MKAHSSITKQPDAVYPRNESFYSAERNVITEPLQRTISRTLSLTLRQTDVSWIADFISLKTFRDCLRVGDK